MLLLSQCSCSPQSIKKTITRSALQKETSEHAIPFPWITYKPELSIAGAPAQRTYRAKTRLALFGNAKKRSEAEAVSRRDQHSVMTFFLSRIQKRKENDNRAISDSKATNKRQGRQKSRRSETRGSDRAGFAPPTAARSARHSAVGDASVGDASGGDGSGADNNAREHVAAAAPPPPPRAVDPGGSQRRLTGDYLRQQRKKVW